MPTIHAKLPDALENHDIRRACYAVEAIFRAGTILDELPPAALEEIRDYCTAWNEDRKGSFSRFKHAWIDMVVEHLNDQRLRENRLYTAITGRNYRGSTNVSCPAAPNLPDSSRLHPRDAPD
jgi:hypothetical protein